MSATYCGTHFYDEDNNEIISIRMVSPKNHQKKYQVHRRELDKEGFHELDCKVRMKSFSVIQRLVHDA